jgi:hypothetical protein
MRDEKGRRIDMSKLERKEGIEYLLCEHLENGLMKDEDAAIWLGDKKRVVLCPLCAKMEFGNNMVVAYALMGKSDKFIKRYWKWFTERVDKWAHRLLSQKSE